MRINRIFSYPSCCPRTGGGESNNIQVDWSRTSRKQLSLLKPECGQTKLTDYFALLNKIENVMQRHPELHKVVTNVDTIKATVVK